MSQNALSPTRQATGRRPWSEKSYLAAVWARLRKDRMAILSIVVLTLIAALSLLAPWLSVHLLGHDPTAIDLDHNFAPPSSEHWLGTDEYGRDVLARALHSGRISLGIGLTVASISMTIGVFTGLISGFYKGWIDDVTNAIIQTLLNIPILFLLILLSLLMRPEPLWLAFIIGITGWMGTARLVRGEVFSIRERDYIEAARAVGTTNRRIILRHVLPNVSSLIIVIAAFDVAGGIMVESGLSFLGVGVQPPDASWGSMLLHSRTYVSKAPWLVITPGFFIFVTILSIFLLADGLRDALDPWLKE